MRNLHAVAAGVLLISGGGTASAQKRGGILRMYNQAASILFDFWGKMQTKFMGSPRVRQL